MKSHNRLIFITCFLTILFTKTANGEIDQNQRSNKPNSADLVYICGVLDKKAVAPTKNFKTKVQNVQSRENSSNINSRRRLKDPVPAKFWWATEQFDPFDGELVQNWLTYPQKQQINLFVNWHLWNLLDYLGRYRFVNQFGTVARENGYSLNIFNQKEQCLATYKYNPISTPPKWELYLEKLGQDSLKVKPPEIFKNQQ